MATATQPLRVRLVAPGSTPHLRLARLTASGIATLHGMQVGQVNQVRTAVEAIAASLIEIGQGHAITLDFLVWGDTLQVTGSTEHAHLDAWRHRRFPVDNMVLNLLTTRHQLIRNNGEALLTAEIPLTPS